MLNTMGSANLLQLFGITIVLVASVNLLTGFYCTNNNDFDLGRDVDGIKKALFITSQSGNYDFDLNRNTDRIKTDLQINKQKTFDVSRTNPKISQSNSNSLSETDDHKLPKWVTDYFKWHNEMRAKYPGTKIIEDPSAPKALIRICTGGLCGGLHDRLGQLPMDLYLASETNRMLFIHWIKPSRLDEFLVPPDLNGDFVDKKNIEYSIDWRLPDIRELGTVGKTRHCIDRMNEHPKLLGNVQGQKKLSKGDDKPIFEDFFEKNIQNLTEGILKDERVVTFEILGHLSEKYLEDRWKSAGETDMIHQTPSFGKIFLSFFQPNPNVMAVYKEAQSQLGLVPHTYTAVHCRVRHPGGYSKGKAYKGIYAGKADRYIPEFVADFKDDMTKSAIRAIKCASTLPDNDSKKAPYYFMSDMSDLVTYVVFNLTDDKYISSHPEWFEDPTSVNATAKDLVSKNRVVAREQTTQNLHIDKARPTDLANYYPSFVDLFLGIAARCVVFGIGNYAAFAAKISHTDCLMKYQNQLYGAEKDASKATFCNIE